MEGMAEGMREKWREMRRGVHAMDFGAKVGNSNAQVEHNNLQWRSLRALQHHTPLVDVVVNQTDGESINRVLQQFCNVSKGGCTGTEASE